MDVCARGRARYGGADAPERLFDVRAEARECFGHCVHFGESPVLAFCASWVKLGLI